MFCTLHVVLRNKKQDVIMVKLSYEVKDILAKQSSMHALYKMIVIEFSLPWPLFLKSNL